MADMRVGLMGVQCDNANLGVVALAYSAVGLVHRLAPDDGEIVLFSANRPPELVRMAHALGISNKRFLAAPLYRKKPLMLLTSLRELRRCDVVLDFTGGDSFSDIYGIKRLVNKLVDKELVLASGVPLVLAPQTYGPVQRRPLLPWVRHVVNRAALVAARDDMSRSFLASVTSREVILTTDVAVSLAWKPAGPPPPSTDRPTVGFNVSGLLWNGGYTGENQFRLRTDYQQYCHDVIAGLLAEGLQVYLVPHVISRGEAPSEDDVSVSQSLAADHPGCVMAPTFLTPIDAKSFISGLDVFLGSRMHATIAAFTTGVPTVPVAYSRKFAGFFRNLDYPVLVDLVEMDTPSATATSLSYVHEFRQLAGLVDQSRRRANERLAAFSNRLAKWLPGPSGGSPGAATLDAD